MAMMAAKKELIGHAGYVIADDDVAWLRLRKFFVGSRHGAGRAEIVREEFFEGAHGAVAILGDCGMIVDVSE